MTSGGGLLATLTPTRKAADLLVTASAGQASPPVAWITVAAIALGALGVALAAFWVTARSRA